MAFDTTIVKRSLGHHFIEVPVLWIPRIAVLSMMTHIAFEQLRDTGNPDSVMTRHARGALLRLMGRVSVWTNKRFVPLMVVEDNASSSLLIKPDNLRRKCTICLLPLCRLAKQSGAKGCRDRQANHECNNNSQLQFHLILLRQLEAFPHTKTRSSAFAPPEENCGERQRHESKA